MNKNISMITGSETWGGQESDPFLLHLTCSHIIPRSPQREPQIKCILESPNSKNQEESAREEWRVVFPFSMQPPLGQPFASRLAAPIYRCWCHLYLPGHLEPCTAGQPHRLGSRTVPSAPYNCFVNRDRSSLRGISKDSAPNA